MIEFLAKHQLNIMLVLSGVCANLAIFVAFIKTMSRGRKAILIQLDIAAGLLLIFDRYAYIFRGDVSELGFVMVRVSNFAVFFLELICIYHFNNYLIDLFKNEGKFNRIPIRLYVVKGIMIIGMLLIAISQFPGLYYTIDEFNVYHRAPGFVICFLTPVVSLIIQLTVILNYFKRFNRGVGISLLLFAIVPLLATIVQFFAYGLSLCNISMVGMVVLLFLFAILDLSDSAQKAKNIEIEYLKKEQRDIQTLLEQTTEALAVAIDAKDKYTHGHSTRVAEYSKKIAKLVGKDEELCDEIYFAALLHDVGKIGIPSSIINKDGKLTDEEFEAIKQHPVIGNQILNRISKSPYLSLGAHYHHERYDGKGYPDGLKGEDIPEIARIIAVADAYDAMTSKRSYRDPIPQDKVREELVKGIGTQFDPKFAKMMIHLLDLDGEYEMKERGESTELEGKSTYEFEGYKEDVSEGIQLTSNITYIHIHTNVNSEGSDAKCIPSMVLFDSLDGRYHDDKKSREMLYLEYGVVRLDGYTECGEARKIQTDIKKIPNKESNSIEESILSKEGMDYDIEAVKKKDHVMFKIRNTYQEVESIIALPDSIRYAYIGITGENCIISNVRMDKGEKEVGEDYIPRIAEEISFIKGLPEGIVPNVEIDGWCTDASHGIKIKDGMKLKFHSMSLPTSRLIWHCPYIELFYSDDMIVKGENYHQFALVRLDGEAWDTHDGVESQTQVNKDDSFEGWDAWKEFNKKGIDVEVTFKRSGNKITVITENFGILIKSVITIIDDVPDVYVTLTGDQCAISNIRI